MDPIASIELTGEAVELGGGRFGRRREETTPLSGATRRSAGATSGSTRTDRRPVGRDQLGDDDAITFRAHGRLGSSPDPRLRHGAAVFEVTGGRGRLEGACGFVTSNFLLAADGELTDRHLAVLFVGEGFDRKEDPCVSS
jgi:hypothetical protein